LTKTILQISINCNKHKYNNDMKNILKHRYLALLIVIAFVGLIIASNYKVIGTNASTTLSKPGGSSLTTSASSEPSKSTIEVSELKLGSGQELKKGDEATFHYIGTLENGFEFDSSVRRDIPFTVQIGAGKVIKGWDEGLPGMKVGGKRKLHIPYQLAYGDRATPKIPAKSNLNFEVELLSIK
jgi:FKBP-type peptidyl-prolyl cis-trans isomerase